MSAHAPFLRGGNLRRSLGTTLNGLLALVSPADLMLAKRRVHEEAFARGLTYEDDDGAARALPILLRPRILGGNQRAYLHECARTLERAYLRIFRLWHEHTGVRRILPLMPREERWMRDLARPDSPDEVLYGRFDASTDFGSADWVKSTQFFEFNPIGSGGTYIAPTVDDIILKHVVPLLRRHAPTVLVEVNDDPRRVLLEVLADHARALRLKRFNIALCQYKDLVGGVTEFPANTAYFRELGINCFHVDPRELRARGDELYYGDHGIDLVYRDHEINDLAAKEEAGDDVSGLKQAIRLGRCVSSLAGEFDHKSAFQIFTSPEFTSFFSSDERRVFHKHVPWTRIIADTRTTDSEGREVELLDWLRRNRERCVLKPNRAYGGEGIEIGIDTDAATWERSLERAVSEPDLWVVQGYRPVAEKDFPVIDEEGNMGLAEHFTVLGLFSSTQRLGILGRASRRKVVNVAQKGGLVAVLRLL